MTSPLSPLNSIFRRSASVKKQRTIFNTAFDNMLEKINFASEAEAILPENVEITKQAFIEFLHHIGAPESIWAFEELLREKSGKEAFRADGKTPNWYHEFRNVVNNMTRFRTGALSIRSFIPYGGMDVFIGSILLHDSWEDFGISPADIISYFNEKINALSINNALKSKLRDSAQMIAENVDRATRKTPKLDENGSFVLKPTGRIVKEDRFGGDMNLYFNKVLESPVTCLIKFEDAVEGMSTRIGVENFSIEDDRKYTAERRALFGSRPFDDESVEKYPFLKKAIRSADGMLGVLLREMETQIYYVPEEGKNYQNPANARPMGISEYMPMGMEGYSLLSPGWHPQMIFLERMETKAARPEDRGHTRALLDYSIYPGLNGFFGRPHNFIPPKIEGNVYDYTN